MCNNYYLGAIVSVKLRENCPEAQALYDAELAMKVAMEAWRKKREEYLTGLKLPFHSHGFDVTYIDGAVVVRKNETRL